MPTVRLLVHTAALAVTAILLAACGSTGPAPAAALPDDVGPVTAEPTVTVGDHVFVPEEIVVEVGTEVTWVWDARAVHDVVGDGFESEVKLEGEFTHTFHDEGAYAYVCTLHPGMEGTVYVVPEGH
jgi:plastocyanin